ncbi:MAG: hypothetical protein AAFN48_13605, partial [Pseudomonadota bacterium]
RRHQKCCRKVTLFIHSDASRNALALSMACNYQKKREKCLSGNLWLSFELVIYVPAFSRYEKICKHAEKRVAQGR